VEDPSSSTGVLISLVEVIILLLLSGFFSASETAMTAMSKHKLKDYVENEDNEKKKTEIERFLKKPNQVLTTILIMNNIVNVLAASLTTVFITKLFPTSQGLAIGIATGFITLLILIFGEITPKVYARQNTVKFFEFSFKIINILNYTLKPIAWILVRISNLVIRIFGGSTINEAPFITENEIMSYLDIGHEEGIIEKDEKYLMQRSLEMRDTSVKEIMTPRVDIVAIEDDENIMELVSLINEEGYSRFPIYRESLDTIVGICYAKDIFKIIEEEKEELKITNILTIAHKPYFVPVTMKIKDVLKNFLSNRIHMAIVVDEYGGTAGLVTLEDVIEELTGEILDEYDDVIEESNITKIDDNTLLVNGSTPINDIERELDEELPETDFETISGFLLEQLERFPKPGEKINYDNFEFEVISVTVNKIDKVKVSIRRKNKGDEDLG